MTLGLGVELGMGLGLSQFKSSQNIYVPHAAYRCSIVCISAPSQLFSKPVLSLPLCLPVCDLGNRVDYQYQMCSSVSWLVGSLVGWSISHADV